MVQKFELRGVHFDIDENLRRHVTEKIGNLDKVLSDHSRKSAHAEVSLKENKTKNGKQCICEVTMHLPHETIQLQESNASMYAAVDIVETKLKQRLKKYKDRHASARLHRRLINRLKNRTA